MAIGGLSHESIEKSREHGLKFGQNSIGFYGFVREKFLLLVQNQWQVKDPLKGWRQLLVKTGHLGDEISSQKRGLLRMSQEVRITGFLNGLYPTYK